MKTAKSCHLYDKIITALYMSFIVYANNQFSYLKQMTFLYKNYASQHLATCL